MWPSWCWSSMTPTEQSLPENQDQVNFQAPPTDQAYTRLDASSRWQDSKLTLQKHSCRSSWCPICWQTHLIKPALARLRTFAWEHVRNLMVTINPVLFNGDAELAWREVTYKRGIGNLLKNLERTEGVEIVDWIAFVEWHTNGFPHWHIMVEVSSAGKAGMIGVEVIRHYWPHGWYIREEPIQNQAHWERLTGYFSKHGYFHGGKDHQGTLPRWAKDKSIRIKRWESMKGEKLTSRITHDKTSRVNPYSPIHHRSTYDVILKRCGATCRLIVESSGSTTSFDVNVPYLTVRSMASWEYIEGKGLTQHLTLDQYREFITSLRQLEQSNSLENVEQGHTEEGRTERERESAPSP